MEICNASDAKREFGEILLKAQKEPIGINKNGKPVAVMLSVSEYEELQFLKAQWLKSELQKGLDDLQADRVKNGQDVISLQRKRITNAAV
ncbi:Antitoxin of toxin-antitoxin system Phd [Crenothrix polyspora]|uniref:Antitoxin n=1 Tax=Crenothrix polyspora TaxID=360316 RepID=A0A1R4HAB7_9GAMM|nr:type II toxin-antitoxin system Phd/YefM family antitoxin [Crenothrix polyspora]SJM93208.1 Antitoxin of toxin-antitoxin system Phd [Crenothrix polyspora]